MQARPTTNDHNAKRWSVCSLSQRGEKGGERKRRVGRSVGRWVGARSEVLTGVSDDNVRNLSYSVALSRVVHAGGPCSVRSVRPSVRRLSCRYLNQSTRRCWVPLSRRRESLWPLILIPDSEWNDCGRPLLCNDVYYSIACACVCVCAVNRFITHSLVCCGPYSCSPPSTVTCKLYSRSQLAAGWVFRTIKQCLNKFKWFVKFQ